jgi:hypothetical protein
VRVAGPRVRFSVTVRIDGKVRAVIAAMVARRYECGSIILTSKQGVLRMGSDHRRRSSPPPSSTACHCDVLSINRPSYRLKDRFLTPPEPPMP